MSIISQDRSVVVSADVSLSGELSNLLQATTDIPAIKCYKIGFMLGLADLYQKAQMIRHAGYTVVYDHQKAGNDIPDMGKGFAKVMKHARVNAAILFPFTGPIVQEHWIKGLQDADVGVIVGGMMTHPGLLTPITLGNNGIIEP